MKYKVLLAEVIASEGVEILKKKCNVIIAPNLKMVDLAPLIANVDALLIRNSEVSEDLMKKGKNLKVIARHGVGIEKIDLSAATRLGIQVINTPDANTNAVAEHALWSILTCARNFNKAERAFRQGDFCIPASLPTVVQNMGYTTIEIHNKILGLVGMGRIALRLAHMARVGMRMRIIGYDPFVSEDVFVNAGVERFNKLHMMLKKVDFLSLHLPHSQDTHHMISETELALMKPSAYLINVARGGIVDERALYKVLTKGRLAGATLDVYEKEPPDRDFRFFALENVLLTPHSAAITDVSIVNMAIDAAKGILDVLEGRKPNNLLNPQVLLKNR